MGNATHTTDREQTTTVGWIEALATARELVCSAHVGRSDAAQAQQELVGRLGTKDISDALGSRLPIWAHATES